MSIIGQAYSRAMSFDNTHISKIGAFILVSLGLYMVFHSQGLPEGTNSKENILILGWTTFGVGCAYMLFVLIAGMRMAVSGRLPN